MTCVNHITAAGSRITIGGLAILIASAAHAGDDPISISEFRIDQPGAPDNDEYFELVGESGSSLAGLTYLVIGDSAKGGSGVIEAVVSFADGDLIAPSGRFVVAEPTFTLGTADLVTADNGLNFENNDNVTHLLVSDFTGALTQDLDTNDDGVLDVEPWSSVLDLIAVIKSPNPPAGTEWHYGPPVIGPFGMFPPSHVYRGEDCGAWQIGRNELAPAGDDTPGSANPDCPTEYYFGLAHQALGGAGLSSGKTGELVVSNIGSSGEDGVVIAVGTDDIPEVGIGWQGEVDFGPAGALATGIVIEFELRDSTSDPSSVQVTFREANGGQAAVSYAQTACASCTLTAQLINNGVVVDSMTYQPPYPPEIVTGALGSSGGAGVLFAAGPRQTTSQDGSFSHTTHIRNSIVTPMRLTGSSAPPLDTRVILLRAGSGVSMSVPFDEFTMTAANTGPITVSSEGLLRPVRGATVNVFRIDAEGAAHMIGGGDLDGDGLPDVVVNNIGSSGQDGVSLKRFGIGDTAPQAPLGAVRAQCNWGQAGALPPGSVMKFAVDNNQVPAAVLAELVVSETSGGQGAVSFIPCNEPGCCEPCCPCAGVVVEALHFGVLVDQVVHDAIPAVLAVGNIGSSGQNGVEFSAAMIEGCASTSDDHFLLGLKEYNRSLMTLTGSSIGTVTANEVRVRITPTDDFGALGSASLLAGNVDSFTILGGDFRAQFTNDLVHDGLPHDALGDASLGLTPDGSLLVANIGSSGEDGVAIGLGEADGWMGEVDFGPAGALPPDARVEFTTVVTGGEGEILRVLETNGGQAAVSLAQDICPTCPLQVNLLLDGQVVGSAVYQPPYPAVLVTGNIGSMVDPNGETRRVLIRLNNERGGAEGFRQGRILNPFPQLMTLAGPGQSPVNADCVEISLAAPGGGTFTDGFAIVDLTADGIPDFRVAQQRLLQFDIPDTGLSPNTHQALGQATMCASEIEQGINTLQDLRIGNIGSSGQDGVAISGLDDDCDGIDAPLPSEQISLNFQAITLPQGTNLAIKTKGTGAPIALAGTPFFDVFTRVENLNGSSDEITVDFSQLGSTTYTTEVYMDGSLVTSQPGQSGALVATAPSGSPISGSDSRVLSNSIRLGRRWETADGIDIMLSNGMTFVGNELRVTAEDPAFDVTGIESMSLTGANLGEFTIVDETVVPIDTCPADIAPAKTGGDGVVNVSDLLLVIAEWGNAGSPADINGDTIVNVSDLLAVIAGWGPCP